MPILAVQEEIKKNNVEFTSLVYFDSGIGILLQEMQTYVVKYRYR